MSYALSSGVTGLLANQEMLDVAGNNLANINTTAFKASRISFSALLGQTLAQASQPTNTTGGTNPEQIGSGVGVVSITPDTGQGSIVDTGNELDMAIDGSGYFVVNDGSSNLYTRRNVRRRCQRLSRRHRQRLYGPACGNDRRKRWFSGLRRQLDSRAL